MVKATASGVRPPGFEAVLHHPDDLGQVTQSVCLSLLFCETGMLKIVKISEGYCKG